jgi:hypothetical protein
MTHDLGEPIECPTCAKIHDRCRAHRAGGEPCNRWPHKGSDVCDSHGGRAPQVRAKAVVRAEVMEWGLHGHAELADPGVTLLKLVTQCAARCELYARLVKRAYDAAERLSAAEQAPEGGDLLAAESARLDLERVMNTGGVGVLIGHTYAADKQAGIFATGEAVRGLVQLERDERTLLASFCAKAITAGLAERMVRISEQMAGMVATAVERVLARRGLDSSSAEVRAEVAAELYELSGGAKVIEGVAA